MKCRVCGDRLGFFNSYEINHVHLNVNGMIETICLGCCDWAESILFAKNVNK